MCEASRSSALGAVLTEGLFYQHLLLCKWRLSFYFLPAFCDTAGMVGMQEGWQEADLLGTLKTGQEGRERVLEAEANT